MRVLIIGGGIAGPVLGLALHRAGIEANVFEAGTRDHEGRGAFLQLAPNGVNALKALGMDSAVERAGGFATSGIRFLNARGRVVGELDSTGEQHRYGAANRLVKRGPLCTALRDMALEEGVDIAFDKRFTGHVRSGTAVTAFFADGTSVDGDVLVGCDGIGSRTRELLLQPGPSLRDTGMLNIGGFAGMRLHDVARNHMVFGRRAFFGYTAAPSGQVFWFSNVPKTTGPQRPDALTPSQWLAHLRQLHADDPDPVPAILSTSAPPVGVWPVHDLPVLPSWHDDRVCLVGDAAHAMSPSAGQGASIAVEDAVELATCLRDHGTPSHAFEAYEKRRKTRAEFVVKHARRNSNHKIPGPVGGFVRDLLLPAFLRLGVKQAAEISSYRSTWSDPAIQHR